MKGTVRGGRGGATARRGRERRRRALLLVLVALGVVPARIEVRQYEAIEEE